MVAFSPYLPLCSPALRFHRGRKASCRRPPGAIPTSPLLRGTTPFRLSPWALGTQQLVRFRCLASPQATSTPLLALERLILTPRIQIQLLALQRFCLTPPSQKTRPMEQPHLNLTKPSATTRPMERSLCFLTLQPTTTQPSALKRSRTIPPPAAIRPLVRVRSSSTLPAATKPPVARPPYL